jgi:hypothetical protein
MQHNIDNNKKICCAILYDLMSTSKRLPGLSVVVVVVDLAVLKLISFIPSRAARSASKD